MIIRKAAKKDIPDLVKLFRAMVWYHKKIYTKDDKFYNKDIKNVRQVWRKFADENIHKKNSMILIGYDNGRPIAYAICLIKDNILVYALKKYGFISDLYVEERYRGKGLGKELISRIREFFKEKGVKFMSLEVNHNNYGPIKFYKEYGFKEYHKTMRMRV